MSWIVSESTMFFPALLILLLSATIDGHGHSHRSRGHFHHSSHGHSHPSFGHSHLSSHGHIHVHSGRIGPFRPIRPVFPRPTGHIHVHVGDRGRIGPFRPFGPIGPPVPVTKILFPPPTLPSIFIKESKDKKINIQFLIDTSSVTSSDFEAVKRFVYSISFAFGTGPNLVEIGVTLYSDKVQHQFYLTDYTTKADLLNAISGIRYTGGKRFTGQGLRWVREHAFKNARRGVPNLVILITGGPSKDPLIAQEEARRLYEENINLIAIGINGGRAVVREELEKIAGGSNKIFVVNEIKLLQSIFVQVLITTVRVTVVRVTSPSPGTVRPTFEPRSDEPEEPGPSPPSHTPIVDNFTPVPGAKVVFPYPTVPDIFLKESKGKKINIQFLIDTSSVTSLDFDAVKMFIFRFASALDIGPNDVEIGVTLYSSKVHHKFYLTDHTEQFRLLPDILDIDYTGTGGKRFTGRGLRWVREHAFKKARRGVPNLVILITGGPSDDPLEAQKEAQRLQKENINLIAIGTGGDRAVVREELEKIAGGSNKVFVVNKGDLLQSVFVAVYVATIRVTVPTRPTLEPTGDKGEPPVNPGPGKDKLTTVVTAPAVDCGPNPVDIHFLVDASGSILRHNFAIMLKFIQEFVNAFEIGPDKAQIGVTTFSDTADHQIWMNKYTEKAPLLAAIGEIPYTQGSTQTHLALDAIRKDAFTRAHGNRDGVLDVLIVITDGVSENQVLTQEAAKKIHQENIVVLAIGVGTGFDANELQEIASDPSRFFTVRNFDALKDIQRRLQTKACEVCPEWHGTDAVFIDGKCIRCFDQKLSANEARDHCERQGVGYTLAELTSPEDITYVRQRAGSLSASVWVGARAFQTNLCRGFKWTASDVNIAIDSNLWDKGQPDNQGGREHCVVSRVGGLNDLPCSKRRKVCCEKVQHRRV